MKTKRETQPDIVLTVRLSEKTGAFAYQGNLVAGRGDDAVLRAFEYFTLEDVLVVMREAVSALDTVDTASTPASDNPDAFADNPSDDDAADLTLSLLDGFDDPIH